MMFDWHPFDGVPRVEGVEVAFMRPLCVVGGKRQPLRISPTIRRLSPYGDRYWSGTRTRVVSRYDYEFGVWLLWDDFVRRAGTLEPWYVAPHNRPVVMLGPQNEFWERGLTCWWDSQATGWWSKQPGGEWRTSNGGLIHPDVMQRRDYRWCEPEDVFTPKMLRQDREHRERAGEDY